MILDRPRLSGRGWPNPLLCHRFIVTIDVPCAIRGATFVIEVENGLEAKVKMTTIADE